MSLVNQRIKKLSLTTKERIYVIHMKTHSESGITPYVLCTFLRLLILNTIPAFWWSHVLSTRFPCFNKYTSVPKCRMSKNYVKYLAKYVLVCPYNPLNSLRVGTRSCAFLDPHLLEDCPWGWVGTMWPSVVNGLWLNNTQPKQNTIPWF